MNLNQLTYFVTLAQIENYTRAAKRLDITQPSLSHAISNLEKELQVPLFERHGRNVTMTKYWEMFLKYVQDSLHILNLGDLFRNLYVGFLMSRKGRRLIFISRMQLPGT